MTTYLDHAILPLPTAIEQKLMTGYTFFTAANQDRAFVLGLIHRTGSVQVKARSILRTAGLTDLQVFLGGAVPGDLLTTPLHEITAIETIYTAIEPRIPRLVRALALLSPSVDNRAIPTIQRRLHSEDPFIVVGAAALLLAFTAAVEVELGL